MTTIRIGDGRSKYGKILDRNTKWYTFEQKDHAIKCAIETGKKIYDFPQENHNPNNISKIK